MGSVVGSLIRASAASDADVLRALGAAPHRGSETHTLVLGDASLGISTSPDLRDAWLASSEGFAVAFTGCLDNIDELTTEADQVERLDPARVVATLFRRHGEASIGRLRGAFAMAITDGIHLWGARDHVGHRALFFRVDGRRGVVASEPKQVVAAAGISREPDLDVIGRILFGDPDAGTSSAVRGVERVPKACVIRIGAAGSASIHRYWHPERLLETGTYSASEIQERFDHLMTQATSRMLTGHDAVALSGGIDSPAIAAFAAPTSLRRFGRPVQALTSVFPDQPSVDELPYVRLVVEALGIPSHTYERKASTLEDVDRWVDLFDGPVPDFVWPDAVAHYRAALAIGATTVLNGAIAEWVMDMRRYTLAHLISRGRLGAARRKIRLERRAGAGWDEIARRAGIAVAPAWLRTFHLRTRQRRQRSHVPAWIDRRRVDALEIASAAPGWDLWRKDQLQAFAGSGLTLEANEIVQHVCGVRARYPWTDVDLWELFLSLRAEVKFPDPRTKALVRTLLRGRVPDEILDRKDKTVFNDSLLARADYTVLRTWLLDPPDRIPGVDYALLKHRIEQADMDVTGYMWARDLASAHAFLGAFA